MTDREIENIEYAIDLYASSSSKFGAYGCYHAWWDRYDWWDYILDSKFLMSGGVIDE